MSDVIGVLTAAVFAVTFLLVGIPLARDMVPINRWYGFRTTRTMSDESIWYPVNARSGRHLVVLAVPLVIYALAGLAVLDDPRQQQLVVWLSIATITIGLGYSVITALRLARQLEQETASDKINPPNSLTHGDQT